MFALASNLLAEFQWDPQIRGIVIVVVSVVILIGSVYLLLGTNVGARVGLLLTIAGLSGWMILLGMLWWVNAQGMIGRQPSWKLRELTTSQVGPAATTTDGSDGLPEQPEGQPEAGSGWFKLPKGDPVLGDASAAAEKMFAPDTGDSHGGGGEAHAPDFAPPYGKAADYVILDAFEKGGKERGIWFSIKNHHFYRNGPAWNPVGWFRSQPHYVAITVQKAAPKLDSTSISEAVRPDLSQPYSTAILVRDRGSVRFPPAMLTLASSIIFAVTCVSLHRRDKELMAEKAAGRATPATA